MGLFDFLHKPSEKNLEGEIKKVQQMPKTLTVERDDGTITEAFYINEEQAFKHSDGSMSSLISARILHAHRGDTMYFDAANPICFEIPSGDYELIKDIIEKFTGMYSGFKLNEYSYTYIGRAYSKDDIRPQPPTEAVNSEIAKLNEKLLEEVTNRRLEDARRMATRQREEERKRFENEKQRKKQGDEWQKVIQDRLRTPFIKGGFGKDKREKYDGVDLNDGKILRIRDVNKIAKDTTGRYIYTARLSSTPNMGDIEILLPDNGVPVVFTLPYRFSDIVNTDYDIQYKQKLMKAVLRLLSEGHRNNYTKDGKFDVSSLHDIGGIDKEGNILENTTEKVSPAIMNKIAQLQSEYFVKRNDMEKNSHEER